MPSSKQYHLTRGLFCDEDLAVAWQELGLKIGGRIWMKVYFGCCEFWDGAEKWRIIRNVEESAKRKKRKYW